MARVKPKGRPRLGGRGCHVQQYKLQAESVGKKLAVLARLKRTRGARATIHHFYPSRAASSYQSKRVQVLRWRREQSNLEEAASAHKEEHNKIREVGISTVLSSDTEESIVVWVNELRFQTDFGLASSS
ncbi:hypothetical protein PI124_g14806 [Phytophthora idaei]|nr:hypothetical protein PI125_g10241 [Phytophthora idaei]KAG3154842.1 hypothetical protein PI126_g9449 [Phytophthora idaei]KAG3240290.1 hypothetical protein PI124_g14806 [Phytophthora idaei]